MNFLLTTRCDRNCYASAHSKIKINPLL